MSECTFRDTCKHGIWKHALCCLGQNLQARGRYQWPKCSWLSYPNARQHFDMPFSLIKKEMLCVGVVTAPEASIGLLVPATASGMRTFELSESQIAFKELQLVSCYLWQNTRGGVPSMEDSAQASGQGSQHRRRHIPCNISAKDFSLFQVLEWASFVFLSVNAFP